MTTAISQQNRIKSPKIIYSGEGEDHTRSLSHCPPSLEQTWEPSRLRPPGQGWQTLAAGQGRLVYFGMGLELRIAFTFLKTWEKKKEEKNTQQRTMWLTKYEMSSTLWLLTVMSAVPSLGTCSRKLGGRGH